VVLDTSAILAILLDDGTAERLEQAIVEDPIKLVSAATVLEASIVIESRLGDAGGRELDLLLHKADVEIVAVTVDQVDVARDAYREFGKGRHPAGLNFGDCFAYALAKTVGEPLLFCGDDFAKTDVDRVILGTT
jgi:ribonuclease VapC